MHRSRIPSVEKPGMGDAAAVDASRQCTWRGRRQTGRQTRAGVEYQRKGGAHRAGKRQHRCLGQQIPAETFARGFASSPPFTTGPRRGGPGPSGGVSVQQDQQRREKGQDKPSQRNAAPPSTQRSPRCHARRLHIFPLNGTLLLRLRTVATGPARHPDAEARRQNTT